jgi:hypothetical protein
MPRQQCVDFRRMRHALTGAQPRNRQRSRSAGFAHGNLQAFVQEDSESCIERISGTGTVYRLHRETRLVLRLALFAKPCTLCTSG